MDKLAYFETHSLGHPHVGGRLHRPLTACAGVVWTKAGYPLSLAIALAEDLAHEAKTAARKLDWPVSAWEFHDVHDSVAVTWDSVVEELTVNAGKSLLCQRPIFVQGRDAGWASLDSHPFVKRRLHSDLKRRVEVLCDVIKGESPLSTAQLYTLRSAVFFGHEVGDAQLALVEGRLEETVHGAASRVAVDEVHAGIREEMSSSSLFADTDSASSAYPATTRLLDALTIARATEAKL